MKETIMMYVNIDIIYTEKSCNILYGIYKNIIIVLHRLLLMNWNGFLYSDYRRRIVHVNFYLLLTKLKQFILCIMFAYNYGKK